MSKKKKKNKYKHLSFEYKKNSSKIDRSQERIDLLNKQLRNL